VTPLHGGAGRRGCAPLRASAGAELTRAASSVALRLRGGSGALALLGTGPDKLFNSLFLGLVSTVVLLKALSRDRTEGGGNTFSSDAGMRSLQKRFLAVFWLFRLADWLQGPYFYEVLASKVINGVAISEDMIGRLFLTGFVTTAVMGPIIGNWVDQYGRKKGSIAFALFYIWGALSYRSDVLLFLFLGRIASGIGTSLLFSAPESWFVGEHQRGKFSSADLSQTFGLAYFGDSISAMGAGLLAQGAASRAGPTAPFTVSTVFLALGAFLVSTLWRENKRAAPAQKPDSGSEKEENGILAAIQTMRQDPKILLVGAIQSLFEGAMYVFVLQWPPAFKAVMEGGKVPFGRVFSCFMASCMLGSSVFSSLVKRKVDVEDSMSGMLALALGSMACSAALGSSLGVLIASFFAFEACVGFYFPSIGTLRSRYLPDEHRSVIMNLFGLPLNFLVVGVYTQIKNLGTTGALWCSTVALGGALIAQLGLRSLRPGADGESSQDNSAAAA